MEKILIVDDDFTSLKILAKILETEGYGITMATNGKEALEKIHRQTYKIVISDLEMPEMSGHELIQELRKLESRPIILVQTVDSDINTAVKLLRNGVYDYILKPIEAEELIYKVEKALEIYSFRELKAALEKEYEIQMDKQLSWNQWKESIVSRDRDRFDRTLFHNLKTILSQGSGFGGLLSLLSLITSVPKNEKGQYEVDAGIMELVLTNARMAQNAINKFNEIDELFHEDIQYETLKVADLYEILLEVKEELSKFASIKDNKISISEPKSYYADKTFPGSKPLIKKAFEELLTNAFKYSEENSTIMVIFNIVQHKLHISFLNTPMKIREDMDGIPEDFAPFVLEPFYRLAQTVDERFETLDFGLGLTFVDKIVRLHQGNMHVSNVYSHLESGLKSDNRLKVNFELEIPV